MAQLAILPDEVIANTTFKTLSYFLYFLTNNDIQSAWNLQSKISALSESFTVICKTIS